MRHLKLGILLSAVLFLSSAAIAVPGIKVEAGGPVFEPSTTAPGKLALIWTFSLSLPEKTRYESVIVEEIPANEPPRLVILEKYPAAQWVATPDRLRFNILKLRGQPTDISPESTPWIYKADTTNFVFRFTLKPVGAKEVSHEQLLTVDRVAKERARQKVEKP